MDEVTITLDRASAIPVLGVLVNEQMDALLLAATASGEERERELTRARILRAGVESIASALYPNEALRQAMVDSMIERVFAA